MNSQDYTIDLDEGSLTHKITKVVQAKNEGNIGGREVKAEDISFEARHQIVNKLDNLKTHPVDIGHGYTTTQNIKGALSTTSHRNPLVYPVFRVRATEIRMMRFYRPLTEAIS